MPAKQVTRWMAPALPVFAGEPAPTTGCAGPSMPVSNHGCVSTPGPCRSGFTREYGGGGNGERPVEIGQQARPFRG